jgi:hypothetical protein
VSVVCCQVEVYETGPSLVQRSPTECGVSEYDHGTSKMRRPRPTVGLLTHKQKTNKRTKKQTKEQTNNQRNLNYYNTVICRAVESVHKSCESDSWTFKTSDPDSDSSIFKTPTLNPTPPKIPSDSDFDSTALVI